MPPSTASSVPPGTASGRRQYARCVTVPLPTATTRWRCTSCGNLTRFDVTRTSRVTEFLHLDLAGTSTVEERTVHSDVLEQVRCRWCDAVDAVELVPRADVEAELTGRAVEEAALGEARAAAADRPAGPGA